MFSTAGVLRALWFVVVLGLLLGGPALASAELIVGLVEGNSLVTFDSATPGVLATQLSISGTGGDAIVGIDVRPATGQLYGLGRGGAPGARLYIIDPTTGVATLQAPLSFGPSGTDFGIDFNPVPDRLRVVSDTGQNLRINPDTGLVVIDTPLAYGAGDPGAGRTSRVVDVAYSDNRAGTPATTLFGLDAELNCQKTDPAGAPLAALCLVRQGGPGGIPSPNVGQLSTLAPFGRDGVEPRGFDISPSGTAFVAVRLQGPSVVFFALLALDLATGVDSALGYIGDGGVPLLDIAVAPSLQFSAPLYAVNEDGGTATVTVTRTGGDAGTVSVDFITSNGTATAGLDYLTAVGTLTFGPGEVSRTFTVPIVDDTTAEADESVVLTLSNPTGPVVLGVVANAVLRINTNDGTDLRGPRVAGAGLTGPTRGITGAVLRFDEDLNPTPAENPANYSLIAQRRGGGKLVVSFSAAAYDAVTRQVTLTATQPFEQGEIEGLAIRVNGRTGGLTDTRGNLLDGDEDGRPGGDAKLGFAVLQGTTVTFTDQDGDRAEITVMGGGSIDVALPIRRGPPQFWIVEPVPLQTTLIATVTPRTGSNGRVGIAEIIGLDKLELSQSLLRSPSFRVNRLTFSSDATGTP
jgi:hypothetical protein